MVFTNECNSGPRRPLLIIFIKRCWLPTEQPFRLTGNRLPHVRRRVRIRHCSFPSKAQRPESSRTRATSTVEPTLSAVYVVYVLPPEKDGLRSREDNKTSEVVKNIDLSFRESKFSDRYQIIIFDFLTRMVEKCNTLGMSEAQSFMTLPHVLSVNARFQYQWCHMLAGRRTVSTANLCHRKGN